MTSTNVGKTVEQMNTEFNARGRGTLSNCNIHWNSIHTLYRRSPRYVPDRNAHTILALLFVIGKNTEETQLSTNNYMGKV